MTDARPKNANKSAARIRVVSERGDLYAARSADGRRIKIGFSTRLSDRIKALSYDFPSCGPFTLIGSTVSTHRVEQQIHSAMKPLHGLQIAAGKELYPASPAVLSVVKFLIAEPTLDAIEWESLREFRAWCRHHARTEQNMAVAREVYAERFAKNEAAARRLYERALRRIAARRAA